MLRKDHLASQIEELAKFMAKIPASLSGLTLDDALKQAETALAETGLKLDDILNRENDELVATLKQNPAFDSSNIERLCDILTELGNKSGDRKWHEKSLFLLEHINAADKIYSMDRNARIEYLKSRL